VRSQTTLARKSVMALTGLFLCVFLVTHLLGNLQLLMPAEKAQLQFNWYATFLSSIIIIKMIAWLLFASIAAHVVYALILTVKNKQARNSQYVYDARKNVSPWYTRNMGLLGTIILIFLMIHLKDFWYVYNYGNLPVDPQGHKDLYTIVVRAFSQWWYVALHVIAFMALGYHLLHGFVSAFRTLGVYHHRYGKWLYYLGICYTVVITLGFICIPIYLFLSSLQGEPPVASS